MYRKLPDYSEHDFIHVWNRCHNKSWFGLEMNTVWKTFSRNLYFACHCYGIKVHAFVLMSNHYHLLVSDPNKSLSEAIGYFQRLCTLEINRLRGTINTLWSGRFGRSLIDNYDYLLVVYKYIYRNPVDARICDRVEDYPWSSLQFLLGFKDYEFPLFDDFIDQTNARKELIWLNHNPGEEKLEYVRAALNKKKFRLPKVNKRQNPIDVEGF